MKIVNSTDEMQQIALKLRSEGKKIALVPTMGFLHGGHASLMDVAGKTGDVLVVSLFVNPTQFGPNEDLEKYPRDFEHDRVLCELHGVDYLFAPDSNDIYSVNHSTWVTEELLSKELCGRTRPIHFRGVTTVVTKLLNITQANVAVFGRKDAQQALIIKRMVRDLNMPITIIVAPLIRAEDNVALSSRNRYLADDERLAARSISSSLLAAECELKAKGVKAAKMVVEKVERDIIAAGGKIDYVEALDTENLNAVSDNSREIVLAVAAYFGATRLIDNIFVEY